MSSAGTGLTPANMAALSNVRNHAVALREQHLDRIESLLSDAAADVDASRLLEAVRSAAAITINFHPDRILADGRTVAAALFEESTCRSQFETGISNGGLTAFPGGARDRWEEALFGGAYQARGVHPSERPKYGGLNLLGNADGACPRFGSCHLRLKPEALLRATFCFGDSAAEPMSLATIDTVEAIVAQLLETVRDTGNALGRRGMTIRRLAEELLRRGGSASTSPPQRAANADQYIEAQVHGIVNLHTDVAAVMVDPSFRHTAIGQLLADGAERHGYDFEWTCGSEMLVGEIPLEAPDPTLDWVRRYHMFCGDGQAAKLAQRVVDDYSPGDGRLNAAAIGKAAVAAVVDPDAWQEWAPTESALQCLKDLWLILLVFGHAPEQHSRPH